MLQSDFLNVCTILLLYYFWEHWQLVLCHEATPEQHNVYHSAANLNHLYFNTVVTEFLLNAKSLNGTLLPDLVVAQGPLGVQDGFLHQIFNLCILLVFSPLVHRFSNHKKVLCFWGKLCFIISHRNVFLNEFTFCRSTFPICQNNPLCTAVHRCNMFNNTRPPN